MKTINFCGDSFCANKKNHDKQWMKLLAQKLNAEILGYGESGYPFIHAIESFNESTDYTVFCWTHYGRLRSKDKNNNYTLALGNTLRNIKGNKKDLFAINYFYNNMYDPSLFKFFMKSSLYWFDNEVLKNYKGKILHFYCFEHTYKFINGVTSPNNLCSLQPSLKKQESSIPLISYVKDICAVTKKPYIEYSNHLSLEANAWLADYCYDILRDKNENKTY